MTDLISRQAAVYALLKCGDWYEEQSNDEAGRGVAQCLRVIYELPVAKPKTNGDGIRAMEDEELGRFINSIITVNFDPFTRIEGKLILDVEDWLKAEVEE